MKLYAVEFTNKSSHCQVQARNIELFRDLEKAKALATDNKLGSTDFRVDVFLDDTAKVYDAKKGHVDYIDAHALITRLTV